MNEREAPTLLCGGGLRQDYLLTHDGQAHIGELGGNAVYAAVGAALWLEDVGIWARIGRNFPKAWLSQLQLAGLQTVAVRRLLGEHDHRTFYAYDEQGRRYDTEPQRHFQESGRSMPLELQGYRHSTPGQDDPDQYEPLALRPSDWPNAFSQVKAVHLAPLPIRSHLRITRFLRQMKVALVTVDPGERYMKPELTRHVRQLLPHVTAFLPSKQEVESLFGRQIPAEQALRRLGAWGAQLVVLKRGERGVMIYEREQDRLTTLPAFHQPGDKRVLDPTGAGDAFCGGFVAGLVDTGQPIPAARQGLVSASLAIEGFGALYALRQAGEVVSTRLQALA